MRGLDPDRFYRLRPVIVGSLPSGLVAPRWWGGAAADDRTEHPEAPFGEHAVPPPSERERGQLLRALASNAIRGALERHFGVVLAFQNCHRVAAFAPAAVDSPTYRAFTSPRGQVLNQSPELRDC
ncbi:MAG TPA: SCO5389 family protein [Pseudonocardia sp.]|nr:SCO5389 family protein [Pseudonocardia sp.]